MVSIKPISWKEFEKVMLYVGCRYERKKGDHRIYTRIDLKRPVVFPQDKEIPVFIVRNNLRILGISQSEYINILRSI